MTVESLKVDRVSAIVGMQDRVSDLKTMLEQRINMNEYTDGIRPVVLTMSTVLRFCLLVGLSDSSKRSAEDVNSFQLRCMNTPYATTFFTKSGIGHLFESLLKLRYNEVDAEWNIPAWTSRVIGREILRGREILMREGAMDEWLRYSSVRGGRSLVDIPELNLHIGMYENGMDATLDINSRQISNTQVLVAGTTGSGKSNLLAVLLQQIRSASSDTHYPVNFLLFDYKGEFSDPANAGWLREFDTDSSCILDPIKSALPFTPFKDFTGKPINELNLYSTTMANALSAISPARISANMDARLSTAIINAYKANNMKPITFDILLDHYTKLQAKPEDTDSVKSVLTQMVQNNIFAKEDKIDLLKTCNIINLGKFPKDGVVAKAIVYFVVAKLNNLYDILPNQEKNDDRVEIRHFTIIDEAHYMLGFENKPLQNLIAVGRNKGMSVILATQNMESFKSKYFDFYQNAQYPLIMKQQQQNDAVLKDLFGVNGTALQELKQAITGLQKGELITKDPTAMALGIGKHWKKLKVTHLI